jgi:peptidoglycan/LPS O-acetylase OafA/YrhL
MAPSSSVALDQWRGLALMLVLISHGFYFTDRVHGAGRVGVNVFFFISGLLVYRSLAKRGDGGAFWWRRAKRLLLTVFGVETKKLVIAMGAFALLPCLNAYVSGGEAGGVPGRGLAWLGQRTYSIYLWQQPLTICGYLPAVLHPLGALASTAVGALSFRWFERPFLSPSRRSERPHEPLSSPAEWASSSA